MLQKIWKNCSPSSSLEERFANPRSVETFEEAPDVEKLEQQDEEAEVRVMRLSTTDLQRLRSLTPETIREMDSYLEEAVDAFFTNRIADCEEALRKRMNDDPLAACGAGLIAFVRCGLSMEQAQADIALELLTKSSALATQVMASENQSVSRRFGKMLHRDHSKFNWLSAAEFRAKTTHAESQALRCFVLVLQQSVSSLLKAGLALKRASSSYKSLYLELQNRYKDKYGRAEATTTSGSGRKDTSFSFEESVALETLGLDRNSVHCVEFGLGSINLALSVLPDNVRALLRFIGADSNRQKGLKLVRQCFKSNTLLSPFASALLLSFYSMLPSASAFLVDSYLPIVEEVRQEALHKVKTRESILHLWLDGRIERLTRSVERSIAKLSHCLDVAGSPQLLKAMPQLRDFVVYDQWFNYAIMRQWKRASRCLEILSKTSKWANAVYQYTQACCLEMLEIEWAEGIENPEGEEDFLPEDLQHIVGSSKVEERKLTFCDVSTREAVAAAITKLYWEAAQRQPVTLGGKPNHNDQFVLKRMEEIMVCHGISASAMMAQKKLGEPLEPLPEGLVIRNIVPLPAYEKCLLVGMAHQFPAKPKDQLVALIDRFLLREPVQSNTPLADYVHCMRESTWGSATLQLPATTLAASHATQRSSSLLPPNFRVLCLCVYKSMLLANSESKEDRQAALKVIKAIRDTPQYKDRQWSLSYAQAFALYDKAYIAYCDEGLEAAELIMKQLHKLYDSAHYFMHAKMDLKAHLASYHLQEEKQARAEKLKKK
ncbi:hypothetical protein LSCM1_02210 [Leishmania martiniquensis]|uniref:Uncharacterized protein n=1 Tax=Leishmania martiniquensis TaxID=1580590 RepID=A0A836KDA5_9TRYP|nr:hypothetical protein LSCM1_02210 [Leishmania martiniquensis]